MIEADFQVRFSRWAKYNIKTSTALELKIAKGISLPFEAVQPHQIAALFAAKHSNVVYKIPDVGLAAKPFDTFVLCGEAYVVVMFYKRGQKEFFMIDIDDFIREKAISDRKSLLEHRAREIGKVCELA